MLSVKVATGALGNPCDTITGGSNGASPTHSSASTTGLGLGIPRFSLSYASLLARLVRSRGVGPLGWPLEESCSSDALMAKVCVMRSCVLSWIPAIWSLSVHISMYEERENLP